MSFSTLQRRTLGLGFVVLLVALSYLGINFALGAPSGSYEVTAEVGAVGSGLVSGTDVKFRGVIVGEVSELAYDGTVARATLRFNPEPRFPPPEELGVRVSQKTLLGEKQVEILVLDESSFPPQGEVLREGDLLVADDTITELDDVLQTLTPFLDAIEGEDLATIFEELAKSRNEAETIQANLDVGSELAAFGARVADDAADRLVRLGRVGDTLRAAADDLDRLAINTPAGTEFIRTRTDELDQLLVDTSTFAVTMAEWLEVEEDLFRRLTSTADPVLDQIVEQRDLLGGAIQGLYRYTFTLGHEPGWLTDGTGWAGFRIFVDADTILGALCDDAGPLGEVIPACQMDNNFTDQLGGGGGDGP